VKSRRSLAVLPAVLCALLFASAALADALAEKWQIKYTAADQAAARAAVLKRSDLGAAGWKGGAAKPDFSPSTCTTYQPKVSDLIVTGAAASEWSYAGALTFHSETWVLKTTAMVKLDWQRTVAHPSFLPCAKEEFGTQTAAKLASAKRIALPGLAPLARRYRFIVDVTQQGETVRLLSDVILIGKGRTEISLLTTARYADRKPVEAAEVRLARALVARAKA
jgi:hypothetical protein